MKTNGTIQELLTLEEIERAEASYARVYGKPPFSLSTWNPSPYYRENYLLNHFVLPSEGDSINYIYYYELDPGLFSDCHNKIGGTAEDTMILTNSGTASISLVTSVLAALGLRRVLVVNPTYFTVLYNCMQKQLALRETHVLRSADGYHLPQKYILNAFSDIDALWLTNPVYNTGVYMSCEDEKFLLSHVLPDKYVIADECFFKSGRELCRKFSGNPHFIGIYDPLKQFLINGVKFSAITLPPDLEKIFCHWADVTCGSLSESTIHSVKFFLSLEADSLLQSLQQEDQRIKEYATAQVAQFPKITFDSSADGHMLMCCAPELPSDYLNAFLDFRTFQEKTGVSIVPGTRFRFPSNTGFSFRINLARYDPVYFGRALRRVLAYLSAE